MVIIHFLIDITEQRIGKREFFVCFYRGVEFFDGEVVLLKFLIHYGVDVEINRAVLLGTACKKQYAHCQKYETKTPS